LTHLIYYLIYKTVNVVPAGTVSVYPVHIDNGPWYSKVALSGNVMSAAMHPVFIKPFAQILDVVPVVLT
jgi:hypothetical protein